MATEMMKVEIIERQTIKPSSKTPHHLRSFKLSIFDQIIAAEAYIPLLLFYPNPTTSSKFIAQATHHAMANKFRCQHLIDSLAKTLTHFYPLAGRSIKGNNVMIECNDDGAEFVQAQVNCSLSEILEHPDAKMLKRFLPIEVKSRDAAGTSPLVLVQANMFECGGMAIGLNISHKVVDASTLCTFINCWAQITLHYSKDIDQLRLPEFGAASRFPPIDFSKYSSQLPTMKFVTQKCTARRYVFDASKIAALQSKAACSAVPKPSRVEAVSALIWKCAMEASPKPSSVFCHSVNLRDKVVPPLPKNLVGNVVAFLTTKVDHHEDCSVIDDDLKDLVAKFRKGIEGVKENYATKVVFDSNEAWQEIKDYMKLMRNDETDNYSCTSWCKFPFYETDFGWGKPTWVSFASMGKKNVINLIDKRDGNGIEAWFTMSKESMALFESNTELLAYASLNPSVSSTDK